MNIVDVIIVLVLLMGSVMGFKRGFTRELVSFLGFFIVIVLSYLFKNPVSIFLYEHLPFFKFAGIIKGVTVLNIALYELIAFVLLLSILTFILRLLVHFTNIFEGLLKVTIVLAPISKIGGAIVGFLESYVWLFVILYVFSLPVFNLSFLNESKYKDDILNKTPLFSSFIASTMDVIEEFSDIKDKYKTMDNAEEFNKETLDLFLKYNVVSIDSIETLVNKDKLKINNIDEILNKYKEA